MLRIEDFKRLSVINGLIPNTNKVCLCLAGLFIAQAVDLFEVRSRDLANVFANFDLGNDLTVFFFNRANLVNTAKYGVTLCGNKAFANAKGIYTSILTDQFANEVFIKRVRNNDFALVPTGIVEHFANLFGKIRNVTRVNANCAFCNALRLENLIKHLNGIRNTGIDYAVGINQKCASVGVNRRIGFESLVLGIKHLHPRVRHSAGSRNAEDLISNGAGCVVATADICGTSTENSGICTLCATRAKFAECSALCCTRQTGCFCCNERLMVDHHQNVSFNKLCFDSCSANDQKGLTGKNNSSFGNCPNIAFKLKGTQKVKEFFAKAILAAQISNILFIKMQVVDIFDNLFKSCNDCITAVIGIIAVEHIKVDDFVFHSTFKIAVAHCELIKVTKHRQIS